MKTMNTWNTWNLRILALAAMLLLASCQSTARETPAQWVSATASAPTQKVLWDLGLYALREQKFPLGADVDPAAMVATTGWLNSLAPFKGQGYRQRARMRVETIAAGKFKISVQIEKETNEDLAHPMNLQYAKWEEAADDVAAAQVLLSMITARLSDPLEVGEQRPGVLHRAQK